MTMCEVALLTAIKPRLRLQPHHVTQNSRRRKIVVGLSTYL